MMNFFFGTRLAYLLNGRNYEPQIKTVQQLRENNFHIAATSAYIDYWASETPEMRGYPKIFFTFPKMNISSSMQRAIERRDIAIVGLNREVRNVEKNLYNRLMLEPLMKPQDVWNICAIFSRGHPLFSLVNRMVEYLLEAGIIRKITEKYDKLLQINDESLSMKSLSLEHMVLPLFIWTVGIVLSAIVFCYEKIKFKRSSEELISLE
ncbi:hypothetical protein HHI36_019587 [Cryptolaemus montrouzieri]|uniref:Solute-binding protein family 3/N-terminal domain-containing protein n=1 Tax=Cryptolaemus montrouzieri TaxID=559131 RepID=A0ABD2N823_9CUCU